MSSAEAKPATENNNEDPLNPIYLEAIAALTAMKKGELINGRPPKEVINELAFNNSFLTESKVPGENSPLAKIRAYVDWEDKHPNMPRPPLVL